MSKKNPTEELLFLIEDRCAAAAAVIEELEERMVDRHDSVVETTALAAAAHELCTLEDAAGQARVSPERIAGLVSQLETLWCGSEPKSLMVR
jgi:hypothetical protein